MIDPYENDADDCLDDTDGNDKDASDEYLEDPDLNDKDDSDDYLDDELLECGYSRGFLKQASRDSYIDYINLQQMAGLVGPDERTMLDEFIEDLYKKD